MQIVLIGLLVNHFSISQVSNFLFFAFYTHPFLDIPRFGDATEIGSCH